jgi:putative ABC transport system permease protein
MGHLREWLTRLGVLLTRRTRSRDADLRSELEFHREMIEADLVKRGVEPSAAYREARLRVGGAAQLLDQYGDQRSWRLGESFLQDLRYGLRSFARTPGFTIAAVVTLALGIGVTTTVLTVVRTVLLQPLPYATASRLVIISEDARGEGVGNIGFGTFAEFRDRTRSLSAMAAIRSWQTTLVTTEAERLAGMRVSWNYFDLLDASPALGRTFTAADDHPDRWRVVVLSDALWRRRFGADPGVVGRTVRMNDESFEVIGVMPAAFEDVLSARFYQPAEIWSALGYAPSLPYACRSCRHLKAIGALAPGSSAADASTELDVTRSALATQFPSDYGDGRGSAVPLGEVIAGPVRPALLMLLTAAGFVLLIACANIASLLLARGTSRTKELAVRAALGAGRGRLVRQLVTESLLLWTLGGLVGAAAGALAVNALVANAPVDLPRAGSIVADGWLLGAALAIAALTGLLFGAAPALVTSRALGRSLRGDGRGNTAGSTRLRQVLVVADLAVALVLLVGAGLMTRSVGRLLEVNPGFNSAGVLTAQFSLVGAAYREDTAVRTFIDRLIERVGALPGVESAAAAGQVPMGGNGDQFGVYLEGLEPARGGDAPSAERYSVTPHYFAVMQIPLVRGRLLLPADSASSEPVALVSETAARSLFHGLDPIGRRMKVGSSPGTPWRTIVGIVGDVRHAQLSETISPQMYLPQSQFTDSFLVLAVRTSLSDPTRLTPDVRSALRDLDPSVPMYKVASLETLLAASSARARFVSTLLRGFSAVSLLLAAVGLYGVVAFAVARRTREVGVRVALGARPAHILGMVFGSGAATIAVGVATGVALALPMARLIESELFAVRPFDLPTLAGAVMTLLLIAAVAHLVPMRRALRVDPTIALREE